MQLCRQPLRRVESWRNNNSKQVGVIIYFSCHLPRPVTSNPFARSCRTSSICSWMKTRFSRYRSSVSAHTSICTCHSRNPTIQRDNSTIEKHIWRRHCESNLQLGQRATWDYGMWLRNWLAIDSAYAVRSRVWMRQLRQSSM